MLMVCDAVCGQDADAAKVELGSRTAKNGFRNEDAIRDKFNQRNSDTDARLWLVAMNDTNAEILDVDASRPSGGRNGR